MDASTFAYTARAVTKSFSGIHVLHGVDFCVRPGTVHGLVGHNGAGKSTLLKILAGAQPPDSGTLSIGPKVITLSSPHDALQQGIACVYQELRLIPELSIAQNLFLGRELRRGFVKDDATMQDYARTLLAAHSIDEDPATLVKDISHPLKQMIEVIANLDRNAQFLFLDEPTTALNGEQAEKLLREVRQIALDRKIGIVFVSHKLDEIMAVCDEVSVMSGGRVILHAQRSALEKKTIIDAIMGDASAHVSHRRPPPSAEKDSQTPVLEVRNLKTSRLRNITMQARKGEVLGIYGLVGSGRTRFCRTLYGMEEIDAGTILIDGKATHSASPTEALANGVTYLTEERKRDGFIPLMSGLANVVLPTLARYRQMGVVDHSTALASARAHLQRVQAHGNVEGPIQALSGGNQQKVLFARIIEQNARIALLDEPTKGVDIGAKNDIYAVIRLIADAGCCVIVVSSDEDEILEVADRVVIFRQGVCDSPAIPAAELTAATLRQSAWTPAA